MAGASYVEPSFLTSRFVCMCSLLLRKGQVSSKRLVAAAYRTRVADAETARSRLTRPGHLRAHRCCRCESSSGQGIRGLRVSRATTSGRPHRMSRAPIPIRSRAPITRAAMSAPVKASPAVCTVGADPRAAVIGCVPGTPNTGVVPKRPAIDSGGATAAAGVWTVGADVVPAVVTLFAAAVAGVLAAGVLALDEAGGVTGAGGVHGSIHTILNLSSEPCDP